MTNVITESFRSVLTTLQFVGIYHEYKRSKLQEIWTYILYSMCLTVTILGVVHLLVEEINDTFQKTEAVVVLSDSVAACLKVAIFLKNRSRLMKCIQFFGDPRFAPKNNIEERIMGECLLVCRRNIRIFATIISFVLVTWNIIPFFESGGNLLPIKIWLPYELVPGSLMFYVIYFCVVTVGIYLGISAMLDPLIGSLVYHAVTQLKILVNCNEYDTVETEHVFQSLKKCILLHNGILDFVAEFENCFSLCVFSQIAGTAIGLSFCCIGLAFNSFQGINGIMFIVCYLALGVQLFFYCHYGTLLYEENKGLINAVYMSPWYIYNTKARQMLLIIMERSKLPLNITAGKVMNLTYSTFITTLKTSYSWITVLKNYN